MIPGIKAKPTYTLNIPKLSGGINLRDGISLIQDNQLTDCKNMWYKDGMLRTRPRVLSNDSLIENNTQSIKEPYDYVLNSHNVYVNNELKTVINGKNYCLETIVLRYQLPGTVSLIYSELKFNYINENDPTDIITVGNINFGAMTSLGRGPDYANNFEPLTIQHNGDIYCFVAHQIIKIKRTGENEYKEPVILTENDIYTPLVATNCLPASATNFRGPGGNSINGHNLLTRYYKVEYSTVDNNAESNEMRYLLPHRVQISSHDGTPEPYAVGKTVTAEYTTISGQNYKHKVTINDYGEGHEEKPEEGHEEDPTDGFTMHVWRDEVYFLDENETYVTVTKGEYVKNNLIITAPGPYDVLDTLKVFNMTKSAWFGGAAYGIHGGSRLFLGGNKTDSEQALIVWSDLNNPLYFSENNYTYVGDKSQAVTAFGRQADSLVIFKEREIFQTQYVRSEDVTAEDVINQNAVDLSTLTAYFPVTQIHGYIGCDCPDTVQLCRNRLVWTNSDGKVYSLVTQNQYNERAVFEISEMIGKRLSAEKNLKSAVSADWDGHYMLFVDNHVYVMDYNSYGYNYIYSYSKEEDANLHIPWYYWELPIKPDTVAATGGYLLMPVCVAEGTYGNVEAAVNMFYIDGSSGADDIKMPVFENGWELKSNVFNIQSLIQTKLFDFNQPAVLKSVPVVNFSLGYNGGVPISVEFLSERQIPDRHTVTVDGVYAQDYSPEFMHSVRLFPYTKGTVRFGARITCDGELLIDSMSLQYKALGGAK